MSTPPVTPPPLPLGKGVSLIAQHPAGLFALEKPEGVLAHPNEDEGSKRTLLLAPYDNDSECYKVKTDNGEKNFYLLHRLDSPTSGLILIADNLPLAEAIRKAFREHRIQKTYNAIVSGSVRKPHGEWIDTLTKRNEQGSHVRSATGGNQSAKAHYKFLKRSLSGRLHLLELKPTTGRTHQLRVQCAEHDYPIVGDRTYGNFKLNTDIRKKTGEKRLFLHACHVSISIPFKGSTLTFDARSPLPDNFEKLFHLKVD